MIDKTVNPKTAEMLESVAPASKTGLSLAQELVSLEIKCKACSYDLMGMCMLNIVGHRCLFVPRRNK